MKDRRIVLFITAVIIPAFLTVSLMLQKTPDVQLDGTKINDTVKTLSSYWESIQAGNGLPELDHGLDYTVIDNSGNLIAATQRGLSETINDAIQNRDTIVDIRVDNEVMGKAVFYNDTALVLQKNRTNLMMVSILIFLTVMILLAGYTFYLRAVLLRPFGKLAGFARRIAAGNLDMPLEMDRHNIFGAFTESFDIMREELHKARENERKADQSKKELVASLSHDIKTPVASIQAVTELMLLTAKDEEDKKQLEIINAKTEQINTLITNMFHATLEELQALSVSVAEIHSTAMPGLIQNADYKGKINPFTIPSCIVLADAVRLQQVFDNIIGNSYKYAGTEIKVSAAFEEQHLILEIIDFGAGVTEEELPLLFNKFFRGKMGGAKSGYGLGLYISKYLMEQMSGEIRCYNRPGGFSVRLMLRLAG